MIFILDLTILIISFAFAYYLGLRLRWLIPKGKTFIGVICCIVVLTLFWIIKVNFFLSDKSFLNTISFGVVYGLAFGIGNRNRNS